MGTASETRYMARALTLAAAAKGRTSPNPAVGCVVVSQGQIVGEGYTQPAGGPHAESVALRVAGPRARGAELYTTLEPCSHFGRTPPCTDAIVAAGVAAVHCATLDPNPLVAGRGVQALRAADVRLTVGEGAEEARLLNEDFARYILTGLPYVTAKFAMSLDGKIATRTGDSRYITGPASRRLVHLLRDQVDAILVGAGTIIADNPQLTTRLDEGEGRRTKDEGRRTKDGGRRTKDGGRRTKDGGRRTKDGGQVATEEAVVPRPDGSSTTDADHTKPFVFGPSSFGPSSFGPPPRPPRHPWRLVADSALRVPPEARVFDPSLPGRTAVLTTAAAPPERVAALERRGVEVIVLPARDGRVDLSAALAELGRREVMHLLVEGGSTLLGALFDLDAVDRVLAFVAPTLIGGSAAPGPIAGSGVARLTDARRLQEVSVQVLGDDVLIQGYPRRAPWPEWEE